MALGFRELLTKLTEAHEREVTLAAVPWHGRSKEGPKGGKKPLGMIYLVLLNEIYCISIHIQHVKTDIYVNIHIYIYIYLIHTHTYIYILYIYIYIYVYIHYIYIYVDICVHIIVRAYIHECMYINVHKQLTDK